MSLRVIDEPAYRNRKLVFKDRLHAGELLASKLQDHISRENAQLLAIPAGGVPVGYAVAKRLHAPLDVVIVRKIQIPWNPEAGFGAIAWDGTVVLNEALVAQLGLSTELIRWCISRTQETIRRRLDKFRGNKPLPELKNKTVALIDDGLASGFTMLTAVKSVKKRKPEKLIVAVPTASQSATELVAPNIDKLICLNVRGGPIFAVADAYQEWYDLSDEEVMEFLRKAHGFKQ